MDLIIQFLIVKSNVIIVDMVIIVYGKNLCNINTNECVKCKDNKITLDNINTNSVWYYSYNNKNKVHMV